MLRRRTTVQVTRLAVTISMLAFAAPGCSDSRTPYEAYLDCDNAIAEATSTRGVLACYTDYDLDVLRAEAKANDTWLAQFQKSRPVVKRLHEEQLQDVVDESILLIAGHTESGRPVAITVLMHRDGGRWKIAKEESLAKGATQDDQRPHHVSLQLSGQSQWSGEDIAGSIGTRPSGVCEIRISHVFEFPSIRFPVHCERLATPGNYGLAEMASQEPIFFYDHQHVGWGDVSAGKLTVANAANGLVTGNFTFELESVGKNVTVSGSFSDLPFNHGDRHAD